MDERLFYEWNTWKSGRYKPPSGIIERDIQGKAVRSLKEKEITILLGLRQTGKSTLAFQLIGHLLKEDVSPEKSFHILKECEERDIENA